MFENNIILQPFEETLQAGEVRAIHAYSNMLTILENTAANKIYIGLGDMQPVPLRAGLQYELPQGDTFNKLIIYNQSAAATTVSFILSVGKITDNRLTINSEVVVRNITNDVQSGAAIAVGTSTPATARLPVLPAGTREVFITNSGNYDIWYGDSTVNPSANRGQCLQPGQTVVLTSTARLYFVAKDGSSVISYNCMLLV